MQLVLLLAVYTIIILISLSNILTQYDVNDIGRRVIGYNYTPNVTIHRKSKVLIVSVCKYPPRHRDSKLAAIAMQNHEQYAAIHGYDYLLLNQDIRDRNFSGTWRKYYNKPIQLRHLFSERNRYNISIYDTEYSYVLWIDNDVLFMNCSVSIDDVVHSSIDFYATNNITIHPNIIMTGDIYMIVSAGQILFRIHPDTKRFIEEWYAYCIRISRFDLLLSDAISFNAMIQGIVPSSKSEVNQATKEQKCCQEWNHRNFLIYRNESQTLHAYKDILLPKYQQTIAIIPARLMATYWMQDYEDGHFIIHFPHSRNMQNFPVYARNSTCAQMQVLNNTAKLNNALKQD